MTLKKSTMYKDNVRETNPMDTYVLRAEVDVPGGGETAIYLMG